MIATLSARLMAKLATDTVALMASPGVFDEWQMELHGHRTIYRIAGDGPAVVLIHGMLNSSRHWEQVALQLSDRYTVVAPDLIGHGDSGGVRGDYSLGAHAASIRDLLTAIGIERASVVGHSLGGGVAMQFFYQFPQRVQRLALISSGGLGQKVSPMLRGAALPGAAALLWLGTQPRLHRALWRWGEALERREIGLGEYLKATARAMRPLDHPGARRAFLQTLRSVIDARGQKVSARDRLHLLDPIPTLIVWGERDHTIPLGHGRAAHAEVPHSRFVTLPRAAHFPHIEDPDGLAAALAEWLDSTEPGSIDDEEWGSIVAARSPRRRIRDFAR
jgi:pimeloyl-ACP methyl ester carboxylesterase